MNFSTLSVNGDDFAVLYFERKRLAQPTKTIHGIVENNSSIRSTFYWTRRGFTRWHCGKTGLLMKVAINGKGLSISNAESYICSGRRCYRYLITFRENLSNFFGSRP